MDENKVKELIAQLRKEAKTCIIIVKDSSGDSLGAVKGSTVDFFDNVLAMVEAVLRKDTRIPPREHVGKIVTELLFIVKMIEHEKEKPTAAATDVSDKQNILRKV